MYLFEHVLGYFVFNEKGQFVKELRKNSPEWKEKDSLLILPEKMYEETLSFFRLPKFFSRLHDLNMTITKKDIRESVTDDLHIINAVRVIEDLTKAQNLLTKRLREWYEYHNPEFSRMATDQERFVSTIITSSKEELMASFGITETMGADFSEYDLNTIRLFSEQIKDLIDEKDKLKIYIEEKMKHNCPNMLHLAGALIGAYLLEHAGSLKHLSEMPASTIQLLGAEKALFRHIKSGARCPKYGVLLNHPFVRDAKTKLKGKAARMLADKISIAVKVDYFKGDFVADKLQMQLDKKKGGLR
jgi:nucleolar protein 56